MKKIHYNRAQLLFKVIRAIVSVAIGGRGGGKSHRITSQFLLDCMLAMPRSVGGLLIPSYSGMEKITAQIYSDWAEHGYMEGTHYVISQRPPDYWPRAYNAPKKDFKHYVSLYNGSGFYYLSAKTPHNGSNMDFLGVEEAKLIKEEKYRETALAIRGNELEFGGNPMHGAIQIVTDMPRPEDHNWFMEWEKNYDKQAIKMILALVAKIQAIKKGEKKPSNLAKYQKQLAELRLMTTFFFRFSALDNIHALGFRYFQTQQATLSEYDFCISLLNLEPRKVQGGFYGKLSRKLHGYRTGDRSDVMPGMPLSIACDYNSAICCMVIGQYDDDEFRVVDALHVQDPLFLEALAEKFIHRYANHPNRTLYYHYDPQALQGRNALSNRRYADTMKNLLKLGNFNVIMQYHKEEYTHNDRYKFFNELLSDSYPIRFRMNLTTCTWLEKSLNNAKAIDKEGRIYKKKTDETDKNKDQRTTTHYSEALDVLLLGEIKKRMTKAKFINP